MIGEDMHMAESETTETTGATLRSLWLRSQLSMHDLALAAGYKAASGIQRYLDPAHARPLPVDLARRFATVLRGRGTPPIDENAVLALAGFPAAPNAAILRFEGDGLDAPLEKLPVWGSGLGAERLFEGEAIEQTDLNSGAELDYVRRPSILRGKKNAYALHVQGSSMHPALPDGELVVACRDMPLSVGDNVVVYLRDTEEDDGERSRGVLVKELVRRSAKAIELRQYEPRIDFSVPTADVLRIDRILTRREMVS